MELLPTVQNWESSMYLTIMQKFKSLKSFPNFWEAWKSHKAYNIKKIWSMIDSEPK